MQRFLTRWTLAQTLTGVGLAVFLALALAAALTSAAFRSGGIGGVEYQRIAAGKDLLGDILPPPEYLIETYLEASLILIGQGELEAHKARLKQLRSDFDDRRAYWRNSALPPQLARQIVDVAGDKADAMWREIDAGFLPAAAAHDSAGLADSFKRLSDLYAAHRAAIDIAVTEANAFDAATETAATARIAAYTAALYALYGLALVILIGAGVLLVRSVARPIAGVAHRLAALGARTAHAAQVTDMQMRLEGNLATLRSALAERGPPRVEGGRLYFGDYLANGETEIIDAVGRRFGAVATLFLGDERVATTLKDGAGRRAVGTRLAPGPVHQKLFAEGATYQGETKLLGENFVAVYEPILIDDRVAGALFVGVPLPPTAASGSQCERNEARRMLAALADVDAALTRHDALAEQALQARYSSADADRRLVARAAAAAAGQRVVVCSLTEALARLAENDLAHRIETEFPAEYRALQLNFDRAAATLAEAVGAVVAQGLEISAVSRDVSQHADRLSQRSEQQAAGLEESSAALAQISDSAKRSAAGAARARTAVAAADSEAARGAVVVGEAVAAMRGIEESASRIGEIVTLIDEVAFQTNLLALNAGVEAARAGEAGRGFAVVAAEVRGLAMRSAQAAQDIRGLIKASAEQVGRGVDLVERTGEALRRIAGDVGQLNGIVADIATFAAEQATGLGEVSGAVRQIDGITQENADIARRSTDAARTLEEATERLNAMAAQFRVEASAPRAEAA